jgi:hypothetical protein
MMARVEIEAGICGFRTTVKTDSPDSQNVTFSIESDCEKIRGLGEKLKAQEPIDAYMEIHPAGPGVVMSTVRETLLGCCAGCAVPVGIFKGMQVAAGLALSKDIRITISVK